jgi:hypothetical protein
MRDVCDKCGSRVSKRLLYCSKGISVFHRECVNGHKLHRTTGRKEEQPASDSFRSSPSYVIIEACDCS